MKTNNTPEEKINIEKIETSISIENKDGVIEFLKDLKFPVYFLDFEAIANSKKWMYENKLDLHQQLSSFSILKIENLKDDETKIKHYNFIGKEHNYEIMAKKLSDFYKGEGSVVVWGRELEVKGLSRLINTNNNQYNKKLSLMIANMIDLQQLFYNGSFIEVKPINKLSLDYVSKAFKIYKKSKITNGKKAHYILEHSLNDNISDSYLKNISKRIEDYNNSDVINIKRILVEIFSKINKEKTD